MIEHHLQFNTSDQLSFLSGAGEEAFQAEAGSGPGEEEEAPDRRRGGRRGPDHRPSPEEEEVGDPPERQPTPSP